MHVTPQHIPSRCLDRLDWRFTLSLCWCTRNLELHLFCALLFANNYVFKQGWSFSSPACIGDSSRRPMDNQQLKLPRLSSNATQCSSQSSPELVLTHGHCGQIESGISQMPSSQKLKDLSLNGLTLSVCMHVESRWQPQISFLRSYPPCFVRQGLLLAWNSPKLCPSPHPS